MSKSEVNASNLQKTIEKAVKHLKAVEPETTSVKPSDTTWSAKELLGHLLDSAVNNQQRFVRAQQGDSLFPGYEQTFWVNRQHYNESQWRELVDLWYLFNKHLVQVIRHIPEKALDAPCAIGSAKPVTLGFIVEDYLVHMQHHLEQIYERGSVS